MKAKGKISKLLVLMISIAMIISMIPVSNVHAAYDNEGFYLPDGTTDDGFLYLENAYTMYVMGYVGNETEIEIPAYINEKPVVSVMNSRSRLFLDDDTQAEVTKITIPNTVRTIYDSTFALCDTLKEVYIPDSVTNMERRAFDGCTNLQKVRLSPNAEVEDYTFANCKSLVNIEIPEGVTTIGEGAFNESTNLTNVSIPQTVTTIEGYAFAGTGIVNINLPEGLTQLGRAAFRGCSQLEYIKLPVGITTIEMDTFNGCSALRNINMYWNIEYVARRAFKGCSELTTIYYFGNDWDWEDIECHEEENDAFLNAKVHFPPESDKLVFKIVDKNNVSLVDCMETVTDIEIPNSYGGVAVTRIEWGAFSGCADLERVIIPDTVTVIDESTFSNCQSLKTVYIPSGVTTLESSLFYNCLSLENVVIPEGVTTIESEAFSKCSALETIALPGSVKTIGDAFKNCTSLKTIVIPEGVTKINMMTFMNCTSLESITLPSTLTEVGGYAFKNCTTLKDVYYNGTAEQWAKVTVNSNDNSYFNSATLHTLEPCAHIWKGFSEKEATCSEEGYIVYLCSECGETKTEEITVGHTEVIDPVKEATCTTTGLTEGKHCSVCNEVFVAQAETSALGHVYDNDCDASCNRCNAERSVAGHKYDDGCDASCNICGGIRAVAGHKYDNDCDTSCNICGATRTVNGHKYDNGCDTDCNSCGAVRQTEHNYEWVIDVAPTCKKGKKHEECTVCHDKRSENTSIDATGEHEYRYDCDESCEKCGNTRDAKHIYEWKTVVEPTCTDKGKESYLCKFCGTKHLTKKDRELNVTKHLYDNDCDASCNRCNAKRSVAGHKYDDDYDTICNVCGDVRAIAHTHAYDNDCDSTCNGCGETRRVAGHKYDNDYDTTCNVCGDVRAIAHTHTYDNDCDSTCNGCGETRSVSGHIYDNACDASCNVCGTIRAVSHDFKAATCTEAKRCNVCGTTEGTPIEHSYGAYVTTTKAGFNKEGVKTSTCSLCKEAERTQTIPAVKTPTLSKTAFTFNNKTQKPSVTVKDTSSKPVKASITNKGGKSVGKYSVKITLSGNYSGSKTLYYKINPKGVSISKVSAAKKAMTVKWKKPSTTYRKQMSGYQIRYSTSSKMTGAKTVKVSGATKTSKKISKLKSKKYYYVQIRTYKGSYYSSWSKAKKVKIK